MNEQPIRREASDTFGRNTRADLELMRRMSIVRDNRAENMLGMAVIAAAVAFLVVVGAIFFSILS
jgi:hypothetical protein